VFERAEAEWQTAPDAEWLRLYGQEVDNIRVALDWTLAQPDRLAQGAALCGASARLWYMRDLVPEGRRYCDRLIARLDDSVPPAAAARLLKYCGILWRYTDRLRAVELMDRAATIYRQIDDRAGLGMVLGLIGGDSVYLGRHSDAKSYLDEAQKLLSGSTQIKSQIGILTDLGVRAVATNELEEARRHHMAALDLARRTRDIIRENNALINLGEVEFCIGATYQAIQRVREAASISRTATLPTYLARALTNLAVYQALDGHAEDARSSAAEALSLLIAEGGHWLRLCLQAWALIAALEGRRCEAIQLKGFVDADYCRVGEIREPVEQRVEDLISRLCVEHLPPDSILDFLADGASWEAERAVDFTLRRIVSSET
jgi:tetratricopeptide (TPR) repeat protein